MISLVANVYFLADTHLQNQITYFSTSLTSTNAQVSNLEEENLNLQRQLEEAKGLRPYLVTRLGWYLHPDRLYIGGEVTNVGAKTATNCSLHVTLCRNKTVVSDVYLPLGNGTIEYWSRRNVYENVWYTGDLLTNWTITPEWSS
jgi:hypothetical protein